MLYIFFYIRIIYNAVLLQNHAQACINMKIMQKNIVNNQDLDKGTGYFHL